MSTNQKVGREVFNASLAPARQVDNLVLASADAVVYDIPYDCSYAVVSGTGAFWYKAGTEVLDAVAGVAFTNQPSNDGVEIVSSSSADTTQTITIIGTTTSTDTVVAEDVTLTGTTPVATNKTDWGQILAVKLDAEAAGTVTVREASGNLTIVALAAGTTSAGVVEVESGLATGFVSLVGSGATTKQIGLYDGTTYDSQALSGTTVVLSNSQLDGLTELYVGDLETSVTVTATAGIAAVPAATTTTGRGSFYVPSAMEVNMEGGSSISFVRAGSTSVTISIARYS